MPGVPLSPDTELTMTIEPPFPASIIVGTTAFTVFQVPVRLVSMMSSHCWSDISHSRPQLSTPALAIRISMWPNCATASSTTLCSAAPFRTSACSAMILRPAASTSLTVSLRSSGVAASYPAYSDTGAQASTATTSAPA
ncbi:Uncharacterised protein [Mycobacteroides abscessus subsp. abscessus]|nr:Uncharacterised protein [Mycobacteroides abscessus subsp. abscessus]